MRRINNRQELRELAKELGVRPDWHEPDEQDLTAEFGGQSFDNAGFWPADDRIGPDAGHLEMHVVLWRTEGEDEHGNAKKSEPIAAVNLATLLAWACGTDD